MGFPGSTRLRAGRAECHEQAVACRCGVNPYYPRVAADDSSESLRATRALRCNAMGLRGCGRKTRRDPLPGLPQTGETSEAGFKQRGPSQRPPCALRTSPGQPVALGWRQRAGMFEPGNCEAMPQRVTRRWYSPCAGRPVLEVRPRLPFTPYAASGGYGVDAQRHHGVKRLDTHPGCPVRFGHFCASKVPPSAVRSLLPLKLVVGRPVWEARASHSGLRAIRVAWASNQVQGRAVPERHDQAHEAHDQPG